MRLAALSFVLTLTALPPYRLTAQASPSTLLPSRDERFGIRSAVLGEDREILVHLPTGATSGERFDVIYVLDGTALLPLAGGIGDYRVTMRRAPRVVFVGITNPNARTRGRDMTSVSDSVERRVTETGGADNFIRFIETEVIPTIEARYPVTKHRTVIGHSLSGLFVLHLLGARPALFERYISLSPVIPWGNEEILTLLGGKLSTLTTPIALYVSIGNEGGGFPEGLEHLESLLRRSAPPTLRWKTEKWPQYDHIIVVPAAMHAGFDFVYPQNEDR